MTIDEAIKAIATSEEFKDFTYVFNDWWDQDQSISRVKLPVIAHILPDGGTMRMHNGRIYDREEVAIAFLDKVPRDASGDDQRLVYERMKDASKAFVRALNKSGNFAPVTSWSYRLPYNQMASIVSGVFIILQIEDNGVC